MTALREEGAALSETARAVEATWTSLRRQARSHVEAIGEALSGLRARSLAVGAEVGAMLATQSRHLEALEETSRETTSAISKRVYALDAAFNGAVGRAEAALDRLAQKSEALEAARQEDETAARGDDASKDAARVLRLGALIQANIELFEMRGSPSQEELARLAGRFITVFEGLLRKLTPKGSDAVLRLLLASDHGRLYVKLAQMSGRLAAEVSAPSV